jgi:hypothetical protein
LQQGVGSFLASHALHPIFVVTFGGKHSPFRDSRPES